MGVQVLTVEENGGHTNESFIQIQQSTEDKFYLVFFLHGLFGFSTLRIYLLSAREQTTSNPVCCGHHWSVECTYLTGC